MIKKSIFVWLSLSIRKGHSDLPSPAGARGITTQMRCFWRTKKERLTMTQVNWAVSDMLFMRVEVNNAIHFGQRRKARRAEKQLERAKTEVRYLLERISELPGDEQEKARNVLMNILT